MDLSVCSTVVQEHIYHDLLLFEEVPVNFKLLFEHDLSPIFNDECVWIQVLGCSEDLPVLLHPCYPPQLELKTANHILFICNYRKTFTVLYSGIMTPLSLLICHAGSACLESCNSGSGWSKWCLVLDRLSCSNLIYSVKKISSIICYFMLSFYRLVAILHCYSCIVT